MIGMVTAVGRILGMQVLGNPIRWAAIAVAALVGWWALTGLVSIPGKLVDKGHAAGIQQCKSEQLEAEKLLLLEQMEQMERALAEQRDAIEGANNDRTNLEQKLAALSAAAGSGDARCLGDSFVRKLEGGAGSQD